MKLSIFQVDAFTNNVFGGNPACVIPLESWLPDDMLLNIAKENAVAETAFFLNEGMKTHLRWFTPEIEMDLCGHATLATAHCLKTHLNYPNKEMVFKTASGEVTVVFENEYYHLDFPSRAPVVAELPEVIQKSLNIPPLEVFKSRDYLLVYNSEEDIKKIEINRQIFDQINLDPGGVIVTAAGRSVDFVSRFFSSQASILEDPVTGSSHCTLIPFWSQRLKKKELTAMQLSGRVGKLKCQDKGERVLISGQAKTYLKGTISI